MSFLVTGIMVVKSKSFCVLNWWNKFGAVIQKKYIITIKYIQPSISINAPNRKGNRRIEGCTPNFISFNNNLYIRILLLGKVNHYLFKTWYGCLNARRGIEIFRVDQTGKAE